MISVWFWGWLVDFFPTSLRWDLFKNRYLDYKFYSAHRLHLITFGVLWFGFHLLNKYFRISHVSSLMNWLRVCSLISLYLWVFQFFSLYLFLVSFYYDWKGTEFFFLTTDSLLKRLTSARPRAQCCWEWSARVSVGLRAGGPPGGPCLGARHRVVGVATPSLAGLPATWSLRVEILFLCASEPVSSRPRLGGAVLVLRVILMGQVCGATGVSPGR